MLFYLINLWVLIILSLKKKLSLFIYTIMYILQLINNTINYISLFLLVFINMLFKFLTKIFIYSYIKYKFLIMLFIFKYNNWSIKAFNVESWRFWLFISKKQVKIKFLIPYTYVLYLNLLLSIITLGCLMYFIEFTITESFFYLIQNFQQFTTFFLFLEPHLKNLIDLAAKSSAIHGYSYFFMPEYFLNLSGYLALKYSLFFPIIEYNVKLITFFLTPLTLIYEGFCNYILYFLKLGYYLSLNTTINVEPALGVIFKTTLLYTFEVKTLASLHFETIPTLLKQIVTLDLLNTLYIFDTFKFLLFYLSTILSANFISFTQFIVVAFLNATTINCGIALFHMSVVGAFLSQVSLFLEYLAMNSFIILNKLYCLSLELSLFLLLVLTLSQTFTVWLGHLTIFSLGFTWFGFTALWLPLSNVLSSEFLVYIIKCYVGVCAYTLLSPIILIVMLIKLASNVTVWVICQLIYLITGWLGQLLPYCISLFANGWLCVANYCVFLVSYVVSSCLYFLPNCFQFFFFFFNSDLFFFTFYVDSLLWFGLFVYVFVTLSFTLLYFFTKLMVVVHNTRFNTFKSKSNDIYYYVNRLSFDYRVARRIKFMFSKFECSEIYLISGRLKKIPTLIVTDYFLFNFSKYTTYTFVCKLVYWLTSKVSASSNPLFKFNFSLFLHKFANFLKFRKFCYDKVFYSDSNWLETPFIFFLLLPWFIISSSYDSLFWIDAKDLWRLQAAQASRFSPKTTISPWGLDFYTTNYGGVASTAASLKFNGSKVEASSVIHQYLKLLSEDETPSVRLNRKYFWDSSSKDFLFRSLYFQTMQFGSFWSWTYLRYLDFESFAETVDISTLNLSELTIPAEYENKIKISFNSNFLRTVWLGFFLPIVGNFSFILLNLLELGGLNAQRILFNDVAINIELLSGTNSKLELNAHSYINHKIFQIKSLLDHYIYWRNIGNVYFKYSEHRLPFTFNFFQNFEDAVSLPVTYSAFSEKPFIFNLQLRDNEFTVPNILKVGILKRQPIDYRLRKPELFQLYRSTDIDESKIRLQIFNKKLIVNAPRRLNVFWRQAMFSAISNENYSAYGRWSAADVFYNTFYSQFYYKYIAMKQSYGFAFDEYERFQYFKKMKDTLAHVDFIPTTRTGWLKKRFHLAETDLWNFNVFLFFNRFSLNNVGGPLFNFSEMRLADWFLASEWGGLSLQFLTKGLVFCNETLYVGTFVDWIVRLSIYYITSLYHLMLNLYIPPINYNSMTMYVWRTQLMDYNTNSKRLFSLISNSSNFFLIVRVSSKTMVTTNLGLIGLNN